MIVIRKDKVSVKFFLDNKDEEPIAVMYFDSQTGIINDMVTTQGYACQMAQAIFIMGLFIECTNTDEADIKKKVATVVFKNMLDGSCEQRDYSPKQILSYIFSGSVVTVDKKKRLKYEFINFGFNDSKLIINYKPVIW